MKPRIEKKLSKRLALGCPKLLKDAWVDKDFELWKKYDPTAEQRGDKCSDVTYDLVKKGNWPVAEGTSYFQSADKQSNGTFNDFKYEVSTTIVPETLPVASNTSKVSALIFALFK